MMNEPEEIKIDTEMICRHCGRCCHRKEMVRGKMRLLPETCPNLHVDDRGLAFCKNYEDRLGKPIFFQDGKPLYCLIAEEAFKQKLLPDDCPYVHYYTYGMDKKLKNFLSFQESCETQNWEGKHPKPKKNCNHCYGRGYTARKIETNTYIPCSCLGR